MDGQQQICSCHPRRKESVLTLDGGGIRGYASILLLKRLMLKCRKIEHRFDESMASDIRGDLPADNNLPLPCHYFDYMVGTSTGGIIAIMLGRLRMTIDDCLKVYEDFGDQIFGNKRKLWMLRRDKYKADTVESFMKTMLLKHCKDKDRDGPTMRNRQPMLHDPTVLGKEEDNKQKRQRQRYVPCRVAVLAYRKADTEALYMFRSYHNHTAPSLKRDKGNLLNLNYQQDTEIWKAARATSAAPTYFSPMTIDGSDYVDGGLGANNPSNWAWREVNAMHKENPGGKCKGTHGGIHQLLSIGTGERAPQTMRFRDGRFRRAIALMERGLRQMTDPEIVHREMQQTANALPYKDVYFRLNVEEGLEDINLDEFKTIGSLHMTLKTIEARVEEYVSKPEVSATIERVAERLVKRRRDRIKPGAGQLYRGLSQPGPLHEDYLVRFQWDENEPTTPTNHANGFASGSSPANGHLEMSASPIKEETNRVSPHSPYEAQSSPLGINTNHTIPQSPREIDSVTAWSQAEKSSHNASTRDSVDHGNVNGQAIYTKVAGGWG